MEQRVRAPGASSINSQQLRSDDPASAPEHPWVSPKFNPHSFAWHSKRLSLLQLHFLFLSVLASRFLLTLFPVFRMPFLPHSPRPNTQTLVILQASVYMHPSLMSLTADDISLSEFSQPLVHTSLRAYSITPPAVSIVILLSIYLPSDHNTLVFHGKSHIPELQSCDSEEANHPRIQRGVRASHLLSNHSHPHHWPVQTLVQGWAWDPVRVS